MRKTKIALLAVFMAVAAANDAGARLPPANEILSDTLDSGLPLPNTPYMGSEATQPEPNDAGSTYEAPEPRPNDPAAEADPEFLAAMTDPELLAGYAGRPVIVLDSFAFLPFEGAPVTERSDAELEPAVNSLATFIENAMPEVKETLKQTVPDPADLFQLYKSVLFALYNEQNGRSFLLNLGNGSSVCMLDVPVDAQEEPDDISVMRTIMAAHMCDASKRVTPMFDHNWFSAEAAAQGFATLEELGFSKRQISDYVANMLAGNNTQGPELLVAWYAREAGVTDMVADGAKLQAFAEQINDLIIAMNGGTFEDQVNVMLAISENKGIQTVFARMWLDTYSNALEGTGYQAYQPLQGYIDPVDMTRGNPAKKQGSGLKLAPKP